MALSPSYIAYFVLGANSFVLPLRVIPLILIYLLIAVVIYLVTLYPAVSDKIKFKLKVGTWLAIIIAYFGINFYFYLIGTTIGGLGAVILGLLGFIWIAYWSPAIIYAILTGLVLRRIFRSETDPKLSYVLLVVIFASPYILINFFEPITNFFLNLILNVSDSTQSFF